MKDLRVVELQGLAPSVFCGMYFADQGAEVILVARSVAADVSMPIHSNIMNRNKQCISLNLKTNQHFQALTTLLTSTDVLIDPYRPGVLEKLKLGPKELHSINPRLILLRVAGYGQHGKWNLRPGHDLNYLASSGMMTLINKANEHQWPSNYLADFLSASLGITGVLGALNLRDRTGQGSVVDCSLRDGLTYLSQLVKGQQIDYGNAQMMVVDDNEYVVTWKDENSKSRAQKVIRGMKGDYYRQENGGLQISRVKGIPPFDVDSNANPFSSIKRNNFIREKGQDNEEWLKRLRPKL